MGEFDFTVGPAKKEREREVEREREREREREKRERGVRDGGLLKEHRHTKISKNISI